jgi:L-alanine-DL-glutamate epimerase-like enolase superfamily enzyme
MPAPIRIVEIERITLDVPYRPRVRLWNSLLVWQWRIVELTRVVTDGGVVGWGETLPHYTWGRVTDEAVARVRGRNALEFLGDDSLGAGLQMALYDAVGKTLEVPLYRLLGLPKVREWSPIAWWNTKAPPEVLAAEAQEAVAEGYTAHKFKARPWFDVYEQVAAISAVTPDHYKLDLDWNGLLVHVGNAKAVLAELDRSPRVAIYESPLPHNDIEGYTELRRMTTRPLAVHFEDATFTKALPRQWCDGFVVHDGIAAVLRRGQLAWAFGKPFWLQLVGTGLTTALAAHMGAVLVGAQWPHVTCLNIYEDDLLAEPLEIRGGLLRVPEGPGLGIAIDEAALARYRMEPPHELPYPRHVMTARWPGGRAVHYVSMAQCWLDFQRGNQPAQERGATLTVWSDDGTPEFTDLYTRAARAPVVAIGG